jgi:hypothetical protein
MAPADIAVVHEYIHAISTFLGFSKRMSKCPNCDRRSADPKAEGWIWFHRPGRLGWCCSSCVAAEAEQTSYPEQLVKETRKDG